ncbi:MAG: ParB/RepB/Spo0J family partition protein [Candidatus Thiodiazotropha taylori]|nr:ParB/RepB/Spo0J family partition protein [Candidatus Thiodiazotropha taylori]MCG8106430.1 ParB/RepB/Spo0J family partition protein [Candidatus Thiodiazotropha taylori]MCG8112663.1 ParB/RepB/Spo0J family partition protein [Candidatus Thiodiazotropha taylori]MCW4278767.1 ParB/RepB/Spo0J family partition protein [Candidatus Thiodiazotropha taylori]MCW4285021.1 ParB/RepB/Spo0J family partition protein [Candidatus Thiodiazotropha taylori]
MAAKKRGLGRGLDALLGGMQADTEEEVATTDSGSGKESKRDNLARLPVDLIQRGRYQPRREFDPDSLRELADSIAAQGVIQPVVVRAVENDRYELIAGERRWRAAQQAGLDEIPVVIKEVTEEAAMAMGLIENIQREDLNPLEEANALSRLLHEFGLTHQEVAKAVGKSRTTVTNLLRLLELNEEVKGLVESRRIEMGHARTLLGLKGEDQTRAANQVVSQGLSVRETERLVRRLQSESENPKPKRAAQPVDPDIKRLVTDLSEKLGAKVDLQQGSKGKGKLVIGYNSLDELEGILDHIK